MLCVLDDYFDFCVFDMCMYFRAEKLANGVMVVMDGRKSSLAQTVKMLLEMMAVSVGL